MQVATRSTGSGKCSWKSLESVVRFHKFREPVVLIENLHDFPCYHDIYQLHGICFLTLSPDKRGE